MIDCDAVKDSIDLLFSSNAPIRKGEEKLKRLIYKHTTAGTTVGKHNISCMPCWKYYHKLKRRYCGG
ncbi:MAG: hypothetical protein Q8L47_03785 [bacterium]|nr:hypothetical protein [bacterium]